MKQAGYVVGFAILAILLILFVPTLAVLIGWLTGYTVEIFLGDNPTNWLNLTLGTDRFTRGDLPKVTAVLALVAMFFIRTKKSGDES